ncbi:MAG: DUF6387 family protein [Porticoccaceae bacterium]
MTVKIKKNVGEKLPKWFDIKKYDGARSLDAEGWFVQLSVRSYLLNYLRWLRPIASRLPSGLDGSELFTVFTEAIQENPILNVSDYASSWLPSDNQHSGHGVRLMTMNDLYSIELRIPKNKRTHARKLFDEYDALPPAERIFKGTSQLADEPIDFSNLFGIGEIAIIVDMSVPTPNLIDEFRRLIKKERTTKKPKSSSAISAAAGVWPSIHAAPVNSIETMQGRWVKAGVLPYLDLLIWKNKTNSKLTEADMVEAIFPLVKIEDKVRRTTKPYADEALGIGCMILLNTLAGRQKRARKKN